jgi:hypothetical protein
MLVLFLVPGWPISITYKFACVINGPFTNLIFLPAIAEIPDSKAHKWNIFGGSVLSTYAKYLSKKSMKS